MASSWRSSLTAGWSWSRSPDRPTPSDGVRLRKRGRGSKEKTPSTERNPLDGLRRGPRYIEIKPAVAVSDFAEQTKVTFRNKNSNQALQRTRPPLRCWPVESHSGGRAAALCCSAAEDTNRMSERKRLEYSRLSKARRPYRVEARPPGKLPKCTACGGRTVVKAPTGAWVVFCPGCRRIVS